MIYLFSLLTILAFVLGMKISHRWKSPVSNPMLIALILLIGGIVVLDIPYKQYYQGNAPLNNLMGVAIVALALPFYEHLPMIRKQWKSLAVILWIATCFAMLSGGLFALFFGGNEGIIASILPKSATMPIALSIAEELDGKIALGAIGVVTAGLSGSFFGYGLLKWFKVTHRQAIGLSMGISSHAMGIARCMDEDKLSASFASIGMVLCGVISAIIAPLGYKLVMLFY